MNRRKAKGKSSIFKGVHYYKALGKWRARIRTGGNITDLGLHKDEVNAGIVYNIAARKLFGEFAAYNPLPTVFSN